MATINFFLSVFFLLSSAVHSMDLPRRFIPSGTEEQSSVVAKLPRRGFSPTPAETIKVPTIDRIAMSVEDLIAYHNYAGNKTLIDMLPSELTLKIDHYRNTKVLRFDDEKTKWLKTVVKSNNQKQIAFLISSLDHQTCLNSVEEHLSASWCKSKDHNRNALDLAMWNKNYEAARALYELGVDPFRTVEEFATQFPELPLRHNMNDQYLIHQLAEHDHGDILVWFLSNNPHVNLNFAASNKTILDHIVRNKDKRTADFLCSRGAQLYSMSEQEFSQLFDDNISDQLNAQAHAHVATKQNRELITCRIDFNSSAEHVAIWIATVTNDLPLALCFFTKELRLEHLINLTLDEFYELMSDFNLLDADHLSSAVDLLFDALRDRRSVDVY